MNNGSIELDDFVSVLREEIPDIIRKKKSEKLDEQEEMIEKEPNYDELFYGS